MTDQPTYRDPAQGAPGPHSTGETVPLDGTPSRLDLQRRSFRRTDGDRPLRLPELILPLGIGAVIRLALVAAFLGTTGRGDEAAYVRLGWGWAEFGTYTGMWAPFYPKAVSWLTDIFGNGAADAMRFLQVGMAVWVGAWTASIAAMFGGRRAGLWAAWLFALYLPLAGFTAMMYSESLFLAFFVPAIYQLLRYAREGRIAAPAWRAPLAGFLLGCSTLTRESTLLFLGPCMLWVAFALRGHKTEKRVGGTRFQTWVHGSGPLGLAPALLFGLTTILTILPWTLHNVKLFDRFVPVATSSHGSSAIGWNGMDINYDTADLGPNLLDAPGELRDKIMGPKPEPWRARLVTNRADAARANIQDGLAFARANPSFFIRSRLVEFIDLMSPLSFPVRSLRTTDGIGEPLDITIIRRMFAVLSVLLVPLVILLGIWGWAYARDAGPLRSLVATVVACTVAVTVVSGLTRYRVPAMPMMIVLGAIFLSRQVERPPLRRTVIASSLTVLLVLCWIPSIEPVRLAMNAIWDAAPKS